MAKKAPTKPEREYMGRVADLGCSLCRHLGYGPSPAEVHHVRALAGAGQKSSNYDTIPLCWRHHRGEAGIHFMGTRGWEKAFGITELELLSDTKKRLGMIVGATD